jgi:hypothetical protein
MGQKTGNGGWRIENDSRKQETKGENPEIFSVGWSPFSIYYSLFFAILRLIQRDTPKKPKRTQTTAPLFVVGFVAHLPPSGSGVSVQLPSQPSPAVALPSSHDSPMSWRPFPQASVKQIWLQPSAAKVLPSSHSSVPLRIPSPHSSVWQIAEQPSPLVVFPSSQSSVPLLLIAPSPQISSWQVELQPSPLSKLPSSQSSVPLRSPLPQPARPSN